MPRSCELLLEVKFCDSHKHPKKEKPSTPFYVGDFRPDQSFLMAVLLVLNPSQSLTPPLFPPELDTVTCPQNPQHPPELHKELRQML